MKGYQLYRKAWRYDGEPHLETKIGPSEVRELLKQGGILVRNTYDFDQKETSPFWFVIKDQYDETEELNSRDRNKIRHANQQFDYKKIESSLLRQKGYPIWEETYNNYKVHNRKMDKTWFDEYLNSCEKETFDYWGILKRTKIL